MELLVFIAIGIALYFLFSQKNDGSKTPYTSHRSSSSYRRRKTGGYRAKEYDTPLVKTNEAVIEQALKEGERVRFDYVDKHGELTTRTVSPHDLFDYNFNDGKGHMLCLRGFCYLRGADRTFALFRMRKIERV